MKLLLVLILNLPKILRILKNIDERINDAAEYEKIRADLAEIDRAFSDGDEARLRDLFNNRLPDPGESNTI